MRVIAGSAKGRLLRGPKSTAIRPALDKVKGAIFNILHDVRGLNVLDLFAGTGSIGIEALSRGAQSTTFVDGGPEALALIHQNLKICGLNEAATVLRLSLPRDLRRLGKRFEPFDLIFVDPPYDKDLVNPTLAAVQGEKLLAPGGIIVVEHSPRESAETNGLILQNERKYGQTRVSFFRCFSSKIP